MTLKVITKLDELDSRERLSKHIGNLVLSGNVLDSYGMVDHVGSEVVKSNGQMFRSRPCLVVRCNFNATLVIFKDAALNLRYVAVDLKAVAF
jgi:hypothetical protein